MLPILRSTSLPRVITLLSGVILAALLTLTTVQYATQVAQAVFYPYSLDYGEGPILDQVVRLAHFHNIYRADLSVAPFTVANYPPVYLLAQVPFERLFGPSYVYGRMISVLSILLAAICLGLTVCCLTGSRVGAWISGGLLIAIPYVQHWSLFTRVDSLALGLSWAGVLAAVTWGLNPPSAAIANPVSTPSSRWSRMAMRISGEMRSRSFLLAVLLLTASIYTRQSYALAAPGALCCWLLFAPSLPFRQRLRRALQLALATFTLCLLALITLTLLTRGGFYTNIVIANVNPFRWSTVQFFWNDFRDHFLPLLILAGGYILAGLILLAMRKKVPSAWLLTVPSLLLAAASALTIGKEGSSYNYLFEISAALCLTAGVSFAWLTNWLALPLLRRPVLTALKALPVLLLLILAVQTWILQDWTAQRFTHDYLQARLNQRSNQAELLRLIRAAPGKVLADEQMGLIPLAHKSLALQPFEFKQLADMQAWDQTPLLDEISAEHYSLILWFDPPNSHAVEVRWTEGMRAAVLAHYHLDGKLGDVYVYRPNSPQP